MEFSVVPLETNFAVNLEPTENTKGIFAEGSALTWTWLQAFLLKISKAGGGNVVQYLLTSQRQ